MGSKIGSLQGRNKMKAVIFIFLLLIPVCAIFAQSERKYIREGNELYFDGKPDKAIEEYDKALNEAPESPEAYFNKGNAYLKQEDFESAQASYQTALGLLKDDKQKAATLHNLGNTYLKQQKPKEAKEAYQQALRLNPKDNDTRYNLALANKMLQKQEQEQKDQNQEQEKEDKEQEGEDDQQKQQDQQKEGEDQENKKKEGQEEESKEDKQQEKEDQQNEGKGEKSDDQKANEQEKGAQPTQEGQLSQEEAERILEALKNEEQKLQEQLMLKKHKGERRNLDKDW